MMRCDICDIGCQVSLGRMGICGQYENWNGEMKELYPERYLVTCPISIETMPMLHYYPGGKFLQITTTGCNLKCPGCVSTVIVKEMNPDCSALRKLSAGQVVAEALANECLGIAFLMNDPLASFHTFLEVARAARKSDLLVGCSSNGYFSAVSLQQLMPYLDFINIGIKGFNDAAYHRCGAPSLRPVLRNIRLLSENGVHVEVSCMFGKDDRDDLIALVQELAGISSSIPLQIMRFIPLEESDPASESSIREAEELRHELARVLDYVYLFNSPGTDGLSTYCPECGALIYRRDFYGPMGAKLKGNNRLQEGNECPTCHKSLNLTGAQARTAYQEIAFQGGYPFTRALEMVEAMLVAMGVREKGKVVRVWEELLVNQGLDSLHQSVNQLPAYLSSLRHFGEIAGCAEEARSLAEYMEGKVESINQALKGTEQRPRVYYAMGRPLFAINGGRMENQLIEAAGGRSVNREMELAGRPGMTITVEQLNALNPDVIFLSGFISSSIEDFYAFCREDGIDIAALRNHRVYCHPAAGWDFGSPRWILGLMYIASVLHPDLCYFDINSEAQDFYQRFYHRDFDAAAVNRSFGKPDIHWRWQDAAANDGAEGAIVYERA